MALESLYKLSILVNMVDRISGPATKINSLLGYTNTSVMGLSQNMASMTLESGAMIGAGAAIAKAAILPVEATFATQNALGELASLGIENFSALENAATSFTTKWAGTTKDEFLTAAYDIKSGISSLTDEGVAGYASIAGITAKATKSSIGEMTNLMATGYGIYKDYYDKVSDLDFGEMFSAGVADSVRAFKTSGSGMAQAISALGGSATAAQVPLEEQLSVLGMLQATMSGSEAGTKYTAFLSNAAKAGQELGLNFLNASGQLQSMPEILGAIQGKFGSVLTASDKLELQRAFGTVEAVKLIDLLYSKTDALQGNILMLYDSMSKGMSITKEMANKINAPPGQGWQLLRQKLQATTETVGNAMLPRFMELMRKVDGVAQSITDFVTKNSQLAGSIMTGVMWLGILISSLGLLKLVFGSIGGIVLFSISLAKRGYSAFLLVKDGITYMRIAALMAQDKLLLLGKGFLSGAGAALKFGAALLTNPVTWIVIGIISLIAAIILLWKNWDQVSVALGTAWTTVKEGFLGGVQQIKDGFTAAIDWINGKVDWFRDSGKRIIDTLVGGILSVANKPAEAISGIFTKVRELLPFSDAKVGPLSDLTLSGQRIFETLNSGMELSADLPGNTMTSAFDQMEMGVSTPGIGSSSTDRSDSGRRTTIQQLILKVNLDDIDTLNKLKRLIEEIEDGIESDDSGLVPAF
ncbi:MAG TPA: phage tail tape measure protein [Ruminiclostridium sp.]|nr:phage tail tape measure protein [Ruminiclostridium sp.]